MKIKSNRTVFYIIIIFLAIFIITFFSKKQKFDHVLDRQSSDAFVKYDNRKNESLKNLKSSKKSHRPKNKKSIEEKFDIANEYTPISVLIEKIEKPQSQYLFDEDDGRKIKKIDNTLFRASKENYSYLMQLINRRELALEPLKLAILIEEDAQRIEFMGYAFYKILGADESSKLFDELSRKSETKEQKNRIAQAKNMIGIWSEK